MIETTLSVACWAGWAFIAFAFMSIGWWTVMKF